MTLKEAKLRYMGKLVRLSFYLVGGEGRVGHIAVGIVTGVRMHQWSYGDPKCIQVSLRTASGAVHEAPIEGYDYFFTIFQEEQ